MNKESTASLAKLDPEMRQLIKAIGPIELKLQKSVNPYESLIEAVVYQQLTGKAAATIFTRFKSLWPDEAFPSAPAILEAPVMRLRGAGLSGSKAAAIQDIAKRSLDGTIPTLREIKRMPEEEIIERLTQIRGVGRWTAEMFLIFRLGRPDVLPVSDYGIRKGFMKVFRKRKLPTPHFLERHGEKWQPYRTTAALYLWRSLENKTYG